MSRTPSHLPLLALLAVLAGPALAPAAEAPVAEATRTMERTVDEVLAILNDASLDGAGRRRRIEEVAHDRFDFTIMSRLVVARHWKTLTPEQQQELVLEFRIFLAQTYGERKAALARQAEQR